MSKPKIKHWSDLPERCYAVMDGKLSIVTRGEKGWKRASVNAENNTANHELAVLKNKELGVTPEQARLLVTGAVIGWDTLVTPKKNASTDPEIMEVELYCKSTGDVSTNLKLPATPFALADALEKLRITDGDTPYQSGILWCDPEYLYEAVDETANVHELNHLALQISGMSQWELDCFDGLVMMEQEKNGHASIPAERLINLAYSLENCQIAYEAHNDKQLGKFYVDNGMSDIPDNLPEILYEMLDYESIGRKARVSESGVFTDKGYVVCSGGIAQVYQSGSAIVQGNSLAQGAGHTIELEVCIAHSSKGFFEEGSHIESPLLPADDGMIDRVLVQLEAASVEECSFRAADCIVPKLNKVISDALYATEGDCYGAVNELAAQLKGLEQSGKLCTYKAMLEAAPQDITLEEAIDLAGQVEWFSVMKEATTPADYARNMLSKYCIEQADVLYANTNLWQYGKKLIAEKGIAMTEYGALWSLDGQTVEQRLCRTEPSMTMEMR